MISFQSVLENRLHDVLSSCPHFGALCYNVLSRWGYTRDHAMCEGMYRLFDVLRQRDPDDAVSYTLRVLRNTEVSRARRDLVVFTDIPLDSMVPSPAPTMTEGEFRELIQRTSVMNQDLMVDFYYYGFEYAEVAEKHGLPIGTVKSKIYRACKQLGTMEWQM